MTETNWNYKGMFSVMQSIVDFVIVLNCLMPIRVRELMEQFTNLDFLYFELEPY